ncbi:aspartyl-phosphate phosphatase Spo0E family protein [Salsuginibacillus kocurii]|uniref:aspartyl-phosphate phosphatase Spo0E family protein n=1 Tax=Salsuginibacillus kocurii TaxID=427078 RepID=UPI0003733C50|nr:aspartyl-phosphate phosphatase Spo0E family protein [Salsuginibacillus kocurii]
MNTEEITFDELENKINLLRIRMIYTGKSKGLTHPDTIKYSQQLDGYLNQYHGLQSYQQLAN